MRLPRSCFCLVSSPQCVKALGHLAEDFCTETDDDGAVVAVGFAAEYHAQAFPMLLAALQDVAQPRLCYIAGAALVDMVLASSKVRAVSRRCLHMLSQEVLALYMEPMLTALLAVLEQPTPFIQERVCTAPLLQQADARRRCEPLLHWRSRRRPCSNPTPGC